MFEWLYHVCICHSNNVIKMCDINKIYQKQINQDLSGEATKNWWCKKNLTQMLKAERFVCSVKVVSQREANTCLAAVATNLKDSQCPMWHHKEIFPESILKRGARQFAQYRSTADEKKDWKSYYNSKKRSWCKSQPWRPQNVFSCYVENTKRGRIKRWVSFSSDFVSDWKVPARPGNINNSGSEGRWI